MTTATARTASRGAVTRDRILVEASRLFAVRGYFGTATRDIADAVGIKQPSLFHHFASKQAIAEELLRYSVDAPMSLATRLTRVEAPASERIYRYLWFDTQHLLSSPYDLTGVHRDELIGSPEFVPWRRKTQRLRRDIQTIVRQGLADGSLRQVHPVLTQELISGMNLNTIRMAHAGRPSTSMDVPAFVADFILRAVLADPATLVDVARRGLELEVPEADVPRRWRPVTSAGPRSH